MINRLKTRSDHCENLALPPMNFSNYFVLELSQNCCNWYTPLQNIRVNQAWYRDSQGSLSKLVKLPFTVGWKLLFFHQMVFWEHWKQLAFRKMCTNNQFVLTRGVAWVYIALYMQYLFPSWKEKWRLRQSLGNLLSTW